MSRRSLSKAGRWAGVAACGLATALALSACGSGSTPQGQANSTTGTQNTITTPDPMGTDTAGQPVVADPGQPDASNTPPVGTPPAGTPSPSTSHTTTTPGRPSPKPSTPTPTKNPPGECDELGAEFGPVNTTGLPIKAKTTATTLFRAATGCDKTTLVQLATRDKTSLSFGLTTPSQAFVLPQNSDKRYVNLARVLGMKPVLETLNGHTTAVWPRVHTQAGSQEPAAWQEAVDAGLLTKAQADQMRKEGSGYMGWRVGITSSGAWQYYLAGD